jgi:hypothetical protein
MWRWGREDGERSGGVGSDRGGQGGGGGRRWSREDFPEGPISASRSVGSQLRSQHAPHPYDGVRPCNNHAPQLCTAVCPCISMISCVCSGVTSLGTYPSTCRPKSLKCSGLAEAGAGMGVYVKCEWDAVAMVRAWISGGRIGARVMVPLRRCRR